MRLYMEDNSRKKILLELIEKVKLARAKLEELIREEKELNNIKSR